MRTDARSQFVNDALGYKWVFWVSAIELAVGLVILFLFLEEVSKEIGTGESCEASGRGTVGSRSPFPLSQSFPAVRVSPEVPTNRSPARH